MGLKMLFDVQKPVRLPRQEVIDKLYKEFTVYQINDMINSKNKPETDYRKLCRNIVSYYDTHGYVSEKQKLCLCRYTAYNFLEPENLSKISQGGK